MKSFVPQREAAQTRLSIGCLKGNMKAVVILQGGNERHGEYSIGDALLHFT